MDLDRLLISLGFISLKFSGWALIGAWSNMVCLYVIYGRPLLH